MEKHIIKYPISRLLITCVEDVITVVDDFKLIPDFKDCGDGMVENRYKVECTNPIDYTKEEFKKKYHGNKCVSKWVNTIDNTDGVAKLVVVVD